MLKVKKLNKNARLDEPKEKGDAGYDLHAISYEVINRKLIKFNTGIAIEISKTPEMLKGLGFEYVCKAYPRSSIKNFPFILTNCIGIIDNEYRGEITAYFHVTKRMTKRKLKNICLNFMKKAILQLTFEIVNNNLKIQLVNELSETKRGVNGYGSTNEK